MENRAVGSLRGPHHDGDVMTKDVPGVKGRQGLLQGWGRGSSRQGLARRLSCPGRREVFGAERFQHLLSLVPGEIRASENSYFCQAARQLASVPSSQLCVKLASGGDPTYAFNIRFTGEEVHGTSKWSPQPVQVGGHV